MNPSVAFAISAMCGLAAMWALAGLAGADRVRWSPRITLLIAVAVVAWSLGGIVSWLAGVDAPARPGVFLGYAATGIGLAVVGLPAVTRQTTRMAAVTRFLVLALLAFVCWRTESVWLMAAPG